MARLAQLLGAAAGERDDEATTSLSVIGADGPHEALLAAVALAARAASPMEAWDVHSQGFAELDGRFMEAGEDLAGLTADEFMPF